MIPQRQTCIIGISILSKNTKPPIISRKNSTFKPCSKASINQTFIKLLVICYIVEWPKVIGYNIKPNSSWELRWTVSFNERYKFIQLSSGGLIAYCTWSKVSVFNFHSIVVGIYDVGAHIRVYHSPWLVSSWNCYVSISLLNQALYSFCREFLISIISKQRSDIHLIFHWIWIRYLI